MENEQPKLIDPSGHPLAASSTSQGISQVLRKPGVSGWTLAVLAVQALAMLLQVWILVRQTQLMRGEAALLDTQQRLATRPYIATQVLDWGPVKPDRPTRWRIENKGTYPIRDLRLRFLEFEKFANFGWRTIPTNDTPMVPVLEPGGAYDQNLQVTAAMVRGKSDALVPVEGTHFLVIELIFSREIDDKHFLYLE